MISSSEVSRANSWSSGEEPGGENLGAIKGLASSLAAHEINKPGSCIDNADHDFAR